MTAPQKHPLLANPCLRTLRACSVQIGVPNTLLALPHLKEGFCVSYGKAKFIGESINLEEGIQKSVLEANKRRQAALACYASQGVLWPESYANEIPFKLGTYFVDYQDQRARSSSPSRSSEHYELRSLWLDSVVSIALGAFAILIFNSLSFSHAKGFTLGFCCRWRCLNGKMPKMFTSDAIEEKDKPSTCSSLSLLETFVKCISKKGQALSL